MWLAGSRAQAQWFWRTGLVAPRHVGSSWTRARTRVPCIGRQILNHCATREAPLLLFLFISEPSFRRAVYSPTSTSSLPIHSSTPTAYPPPAPKAGLCPQESPEITSCHIQKVLFQPSPIVPGWGIGHCIPASSVKLSLPSGPWILLLPLATSLHTPCAIPCPHGCCPLGP